MASEVNTTPATTAQTERYRQAERALWNHYGLEPNEQFVDLGSPAVRLRVVEIGSGEPVLFVPGTGGTGPYWGLLVRELQSFRCLMLDRPGWGLSSSINYENYEYKTLVADVLNGTLDALGIEQAHVVGASIGEVWALRLAQLYPDRAGRIVLLGGGPLVADVEVPPFIKLLSTPLGAIIVRLPQGSGMVRKQLRGAGHGESLDAGRMDEFVTWRLAFNRHTDSMQNERDMVKAVVSRRGFRPGLTFDDAELAEIQQPTLQVYGTADPTAGLDIVKRVVDLLPHADLHLIDGGGHLPWFDDPGGVGNSAGRFLGG
jgi:pimeloyl-ACP methyl ester carboxylesterase